MKITDKAIQEFEAYVKEFMEEQEAPGISVAIAQGDDLLYSNGFGFRDLDSGKPVTTDTVMGIASITKSFTGAAIAKLREEGKLDFYDPVVKHIPSFTLKNGDGSAVTIHHLLTHTAGLPPLECLGWSMKDHTTPDEEPEDAEQAENEDEDKGDHPPINTISDLVDYIGGAVLELLGKPGEYLSYSNDSYVILGGIVEAVSGMGYEDYVKENFLEPMEMKRSTFDLQEMLKRDDVTTLYYKKDEVVKASNNWQEAPPYAAGGWLRSSVTDLIRFFQMYAGGGVYKGRRLLSAQSVAANMADAQKFSLYSSYARGLRMQSYHGVTLAEHGGSLKGVSSNAGFIPEKGVSVAVLCNLSGVPIAKVWLAAINMMLGLPLDTPRAQYNPGDWPGSVEHLTGKFESGEGAKLELFQEDGELMIKVQEEDYPVKYIDAETGLFNLKGQDIELKFHLKEGRVWSIGFGLRIIPRGQEE